MYMPMMPDAIEQAAPTRNASAVRQPRSRPKTSVSATSFVSKTVMTAPMHDRPDEGEDADRRVLAPDEGDGTLEDRAGDILHLLGPGVACEHVTGEVDGEEHGDEAGRQDDQLERTGIHRVSRILLGAYMNAARDRARVARMGTTQNMELWLGLACGNSGRITDEPVEIGGECINRRSSGSTQ